MRPDAIPVRPVSSHADLPPPLVAALFGTGYVLRGTERVGVVRLGHEVLHVPARPAAGARLLLDAVDRDQVGETTGLRLQGPAGAASGPPVEPVRSRLLLAGGLQRAWGVGAEATLGLGSLAVAVAVEAGETALEVDRALWLAAGRADAARWLPAVALAPPPEAEPAETSRTLVVPRRVVTETDVRQARLKRKTIRLEPGQVVTPAALSLGREWHVFADRPGH